MPLPIILAPALGFLTNLLGPVKWIAVALAVGLTVGYVKGCSDEKEKRIRFEAGVEALGRAAEQNTSDTIKENLARMEKANADHKGARDRVAALGRQLRDERARRSPLPPAATGSRRPDLATFDRAEFAGALRRLDEEVSELVAEGDEARVALDTAKRWAQGSEKFDQARQISRPYRYYKPADKDRVCVQVMLRDTEAEVEKLCGGGQGCWKPNSSDGPHLIIAPRPRNFNDERAIHILGHEFWHTLGAEHD